MAIWTARGSKGSADWAGAWVEQIRRVDSAQMSLVLMAYDTTLRFLDLGISRA
jgi:hypothetical protein